jgi:glycogen debranching enzyme GlgX/4-alpha-glucanotransferase
MVYPITDGAPEPLGAVLDSIGLNVAVFSAHADRVDLCLFDETGNVEIAQLSLPARTGDIFHGHVANLQAGQRYGLRAYGPYAPEQGHRFNAHKLLLDPHATLLDRPFKLHDSMFGYRLDDPALDLSFDTSDSAPFMPKAIVRELTTQQKASKLPRTRWDKTVLYEMHVRGFSIQNEAVPASSRGTFAGLASPASLAHLTKLGVTAVEILPVAAGINERHLAPLGLTNYWGYNPISWCAPAPHLAPGGWGEIRDAVSRLHGAGIEVIIDVVLNHSGEGDALGPTVSLRGLDNASYYRLQPNNPRAYIDDAGCGNILACDRLPVVRLAMDALRTWAIEAGIDGFRFDLGTTLGRKAEGFDPHAPLLAAIAQDPVLRDLKLIMEPWDIGPGGYQVGAFSGAFAEWNDQYRDDTRRFWRGDHHMLGKLATRLSGSGDLFAAKKRPSRGINFVTAHDGFTLADLVSHTAKQNHPNGEDNRDGTSANHSWNHGVEGATTNNHITALRQQDQRNLLATMLFSRGTPMLTMGNETGQSQGGNNNAYAQDNPLSWLNWEHADHDLSAFTAELIAFRQAHPCLTQDRFLTGEAVDNLGHSDIVWTDADGSPLTDTVWNDAQANTLIATFSANIDGVLDRVVIILHRGANVCSIKLPATRDGYTWKRSIDTASPTELLKPECAGEEWHSISSRSVIALCEVKQSKHHQRSVDPDSLDRLAQAAGIAPDWWDVSGGNTRVGDSTKQALLTAMGLEANTTWQAQASLFQLADRHDRAALPPSVTAWQHANITLRLNTGGGSAHLRLALILQREDGSLERFPLTQLKPQLAQVWARDGRGHTALVVSLPPQAVGRHRLWFEHRPEDTCNLTVAPRQCYLPPALKSGQKRFGIAAQLYALRSESTDFGIGDFSTLASFSRHVADQGAAFIGLNPLHALFANDRERASPYSPSDRRFLDPIYLDITHPDLVANTPKASAFLAQEAKIIATLAQRTHVDYSRIWQLKRTALDLCFSAFQARQSAQKNSAEAASFATFVQAGGTALRDFAIFEALSEVHIGKPWFHWPLVLQNPRNAHAKNFASEHRNQVDFHLFLQWHCAWQFSAAADAAKTNGLELGFYRDLAVGAAPDGAEVWAGASAFAKDVSVGAPPDPFSASGQVWGLPPLNPLELSTTGLQHFASLLAHNMRHAGAMRIDHVMALQRLFLVPEGAAGSEGAYVQYPLEDMLAQVALESHRNHCLVVGEDLGTVPEGLRERLSDADILSYRVALFEREGRGFTSPVHYPSKAVACVTTHDLPTFSGWQQGADLTELAALDLIPAESLSDRQHERGLEHNALKDIVGVVTDADDATVNSAVHVAIAGSPCLLALVQADDLSGAVEGVNLPGTDSERPNWRRRYAVNVAELFETSHAKALLKGISRQRKRRDYL